MTIFHDCYYLGICLAGFLFGTISVLQLPALPLAKAVSFPFPGFYSGVFVLYLQCHASRTDTVKSKSIIFYALCSLYILSVGTIGFDIVSFVTTTQVSNYKEHSLNFALITGWAEHHYIIRHRNCSIHIIRLLWLHCPIHPSMRTLFFMMSYHTLSI